MRFVNTLSVFIVCELSSLCDIRMVYSWVVVMSLEVVFRGDVIRNTATLAMTRDDEIVFPVLLDNLVDLFLSRFRSRRVGGTTCYLPVYEPVVHEVLGDQSRARHGPREWSEREPTQQKYLFRRRHPATPTDFDREVS